MVTLHLGFLLCICILFLLLGVVISNYTVKYIEFLKHKESSQPVTVELINKIYYEEDGEVVESIETSTHNYNVPVDMKSKHRHRVSNVIKAPCRKIP